MEQSAGPMLTAQQSLDLLNSWKDLMELSASEEAETEACIALAFTSEKKGLQNGFATLMGLLWISQHSTMKSSRISIHRTHFLIKLFHGWFPTRRMALRRNRVGGLKMTIRDYQFLHGIEPL